MTPKNDTSTLFIENLLADVPLFSHLSPDDLCRVAQSARKVKAGKEEILFHKDDPCHGFYLIVSGKIKLFFNSAIGTEKIIDILMPGQTFGEAVMFMDKPYPLSAQVLSDSVLIYIPKNAIFQAIDTNPLFARKVITGLSVRLHQLVQNFEFNSLRSGKQRVADYLLKQILPADAGQSSVFINLPANKRTIAAHLGITPEHFSRVLHELVDSGLIAMRGKQIEILSLHSLEDLTKAVTGINTPHPTPCFAPCRLAKQANSLI